MLAIVWTDVVGLIAVLAACGGMLYLANRIEPHWVARDQSRFLTTAQEFDQFGTPGRKREVRVYLDDDSDALIVARRSMFRPSSSVWTITSKADTASRGRIVYHLKQVSGDIEVASLALRVPKSSKILPRLERLLEITGEHRPRKSAQPPPPPSATEASGNRGNPPPAPPADRG